MNEISTLTAQQLRKAADIKDRIKALESELNALLGSGTSSNGASVEAKSPGKRGMSPEGKARIAAAQRARWAKVKGQSVVSTSEPGQKPKRKVSAAARAKMATNVRRRLGNKRLRYTT